MIKNKNIREILSSKELSGLRNDKALAKLEQLRKAYAGSSQIPTILILLEDMGEIMAEQIKNDEIMAEQGVNSKEDDGGNLVNDN